MKRSGWAPGNAQNQTGSRKKGRTKVVDQILKASYRLHAGDRACQKAVKHCLR
jgi:hypothetical protein